MTPNEFLHCGEIPSTRIDTIRVIIPQGDPYTVTRLGPAFWMTLTVEETCLELGLSLWSQGMSTYTPARVDFARALLYGPKDTRYINRKEEAKRSLKGWPPSDDWNWLHFLYFWRRGEP